MRNNANASNQTEAKGGLFASRNLSPAGGLAVPKVTAQSKSMIRNTSNLDTELGGGFFLTDVKHSSKVKDSSVALRETSPTLNRTYEITPEHHSNMVSFGFLTRVPISEFIDIANKDAQKTVSKHKQRLEKSIITQLDRTLEDMKQARKMAKVRAEIKRIHEAYKTDETKIKHKERLETIAKNKKK